MCCASQIRALAGPTDSAKARDEARGSLRARFGTDGRRNAVHSSGVCKTWRFMSTSLKLKSAYRYDNCVPLYTPKVQSSHFTTIAELQVTTVRVYGLNCTPHTQFTTLCFFLENPLHPFFNFRVSTTRFAMLTHKNSSLFFFFLCIKMIFSQILLGLQLENSSFISRIEREKPRARSATSRCFASSSRTCLSPLGPQVLLGRYCETFHHEDMQ